MVRVVSLGLLAMAALLSPLATDAFLPLPASKLASPGLVRPVVGPARVRTSSLNMGLTEAVTDYVHIWTPFISGVGLPPVLIKWFHGANMGIVLASMVTFGTWLGWKIRNGEGDIEFTGKTARELHPTLMGLATLFFFLGGQGGLVFLDIQGKSLLESPHAITAAIGLGLLAVQGILPKFFAGNPNARSAHAYLGTATVGLLFVHAGLGLNLGLSLP